MSIRVPRPRRLIAMAVLVLLAAGCGTSSSNGGPDLIAAIEGVPGQSFETPPLQSPDPLEGAERRYYFDGSVESVAAGVRSAAGEPGDSVTENGVVHHLYRSGTVLVADLDGVTGVGLFDNDRARRVVPVLIGRSGWNTSVDGYRSSGGSSSGNGFRGGGSGSGK